VATVTVVVFGGVAACETGSEQPTAKGTNKATTSGDIREKRGIGATPGKVFEGGSTGSSVAGVGDPGYRVISQFVVTRLSGSKMTA
jgi:hypothetical protein